MVENEIVRFVCEACGESRGAATMPIGAQAHPLTPTSVRADGYQSSKQARTGEWTVGVSGRSGQYQDGPLRTGAAACERVDRAGTIYLEWRKPCRCGRGRARVREDKTRAKIRAARSQPGPVTIGIPPS